VLAAGRQGRPVELLARATVRSRLGLKGKLADEVRATAAVGAFRGSGGLPSLPASRCGARRRPHGWPELAPDKMQET
jgi:hypothetical protein